jgi:hypothetical protein
VGVDISSHAAKRIRERWACAPSLRYPQLLKLLQEAVEAALKRGQAVKAPGGLFIPFRIGDKPGFLVVKNGQVVTALEEEHCQEVKAYLVKHGHKIQ